MNYTFNSEVAKTIGVDGAVMLQNIYYWIAKNKANNKHFYDDNYWTYNSVKAFECLFPFWSNKQITRILKKLVDDGYLITGNYNKQNYDRTKWYAITQKGYSIFPNGQMDLPKQANGFDHLGKPIPNINTDNKTNIKYTSQDIEGYALEVKNYDKQFILHGSTFFYSRYEDYLDDNYSQSSNQDKNITDDGIREF